MIVTIWNAWKSLWSRANDWIMGGEPRAPVPNFPTPADVAAYLSAHGAYTGDPLGGAADFVLHPERLQAAMLAGPEALARLSIDCDDWAAWAYAALRTIPGCVPTLYTLEDASGRWGHHVVCAYSWHGDVHGVIDTNGHARLLGPDPARLCAHFTGVYRALGYQYTAATVTPYPFDA